MHGFLENEWKKCSQIKKCPIPEKLIYEDYNETFEKEQKYINQFEKYKKWEQSRNPIIKNIGKNVT
jgi:hypothetical protein